MIVVHANCWTNESFKGIVHTWQTFWSLIHLSPINKHCTLGISTRWWMARSKHNPDKMRRLWAIEPRRNKQYKQTSQAESRQVTFVLFFKLLRNWQYLVPSYLVRWEQNIIGINGSAKKLVQICWKVSKYKNWIVRKECYI